MSRARLRLAGRFSGRYAPAELQILAVARVGPDAKLGFAHRTVSNCSPPPSAVSRAWTLAEPVTANASLSSARPLARLRAIIHVSRTAFHCKKAVIALSVRRERGRTTSSEPTLGFAARRPIGASRARLVSSDPLTLGVRGHPSIRQQNKIFCFTLADAP